jgi:non-specific serine/threonine protein kinase
MALRLEGLKRRTWDMEILDEAQAIKNPGTRQTRAVKAIPARNRLAMTGTPVENSLSNLWSLFDFLNPGLLGSRLHFAGFVRELADRESGYEPLKRMIAPFILRRLKTDKSIINDLPEKTEIVEYVPLSARQAALYGKELDLLAHSLKEAKPDGLQRKGLVLTAISKLKQICNHPDEFLGSSRFKPEDSGKFVRLREICEALYEKREPVLVFTQYREMVGPLCDFLTSVFGMPGLSIHGGTPVKKRMELVDEFQR